MWQADDTPPPADYPGGPRRSACLRRRWRRCPRAAGCRLRCQAAADAARGPTKQLDAEVRRGLGAAVLSKNVRRVLRCEWRAGGQRTWQLGQWNTDMFWTMPSTCGIRNTIKCDKLDSAQLGVPHEHGRAYRDVDLAEHVDSSARVKKEAHLYRKPVNKNPKIPSRIDKGNVLR